VGDNLRGFVHRAVNETCASYAAKRWGNGGQARVRLLSFSHERGHSCLASVKSVELQAGFNLRDTGLASAFTLNVERACRCSVPVVDEEEREFPSLLKGKIGGKHRGFSRPKTSVN
jgi:hypothetical protein